MWNFQRMPFYVENLNQYNNFFGRVYISDLFLTEKTHIHSRSRPASRIPDSNVKPVHCCKKISDWIFISSP